MQLGRICIRCTDAYGGKSLALLTHAQQLYLQSEQHEDGVDEGQQRDGTEPGQELVVQPLAAGDHDDACRRGKLASRIINF